jgi:hypothetical protein
MMTYTDFDFGMLTVSTLMSVLTPSGTVLNLLSHQQSPEGCTPADSSFFVDNSVALTAQCDRVLWHRRFDHLYAKPSG